MKIKIRIIMMEISQESLEIRVWVHFKVQIEFLRQLIKAYLIL